VNRSIPGLVRVGRAQIALTVGTDGARGLRAYFCNNLGGTLIYGFADPSQTQLQQSFGLSSLHAIGGRPGRRAAAPTPPRGIIAPEDHAMTPREIRAVACPRCGAKAGERCRDEHGREIDSHPLRVAQAELRAHWLAPPPGRRRGGRQRSRAYRKRHA
jgi:hypothetical protein